MPKNLTRKTIEKKEKETLPGPTSYDPYDYEQLSIYATPSFGQEKRFPKKKEEKRPEPGQYKTAMQWGKDTFNITFLNP